jgi:stage V sporulation protein B
MRRQLIMEDKYDEKLLKIERVAKDAAKGGLFIFTGNTLSTIILAIASIITARLLGPSDYGLYSVALIPPSLMLLFAGFGVNQALIRFIAKFKSEGESKAIGGLIRAGLLFNLAASTVMFLTTFLLADVLAAHLLKRPEIGFLIRLSSLVIIGNVLTETSSNTFIGLDKMDKTALISITKAVVKAVLAPLLILLGFSVAGVLTGHVLAALTAGVIGAVAAARTSKRSEYSSSDSPGFTSNLSLMARYGLPLYASTLIAGLLGQYTSLILAQFTLNVEVGNYSVAKIFFAPITLVTAPISTLLFPAFSKLNPQRDLHELNTIFTRSLKYTLFLIVPASIFIAVTSRDLIAFFYGSSYTQAPLYLTLHSITFLYLGFSLVLGGFFNGIGETAISLKATLIKLPALLLLVPALTSLYRIPGFILALIISGIPDLAYLAWTVHSHYGLAFGLTSIVKIGVTSLLSTVPVLPVTAFLPYSPVIKLAVSTPIFVLTYLTLVPITGVIERRDLVNLALITEDIKPLAKLAKIVLSYAEKILSFVACSQRPKYKPLKK